MKHSVKRKRIKKLALAISLCALIIWAILGTGASLAWFTDLSPEVNNVFHFADFDLEVFYELPDGNFEKIETDTKVFDEDALYEPGYVQVVYLKIKNNGDLDFNFKTAITVTDYTPAINYFGGPLNLQEHLRFGVMENSDLAELKNALSDREKAKAVANEKLSNYSSDDAELKAGQEIFMALIVRMPEEIGNVANYRGDTAPDVELGIIVSATQEID